MLIVEKNVIFSFLWTQEDFRGLLNSSRSETFILHFLHYPADHRNEMKNLFLKL